MRTKLWGAVGALSLWVVSQLPGALERQVTVWDLIIGGAFSVLGLLVVQAVTHPSVWQRWAFVAQWPFRRAGSRVDIQVFTGVPGNPPVPHFTTTREVLEALGGSEGIARIRMGAGGGGGGGSQGGAGGGGGGGAGAAGGRGGDVVTTAGMPTKEGPKPDVRIRVQTSQRSNGNAAGEDFRSWLQLRAENWSAVRAENARLKIVVRQTGRPQAEREWRWDGIRESEDLTQGLPLGIPVAISDRHPGIPGTPAWMPHPTLPIGKWFLTPRGHDRDAFEEIHPGRYWLDVTVAWDGGAVTDWFFMDCPESSTGEDQIVHTVSKDAY
jgi:hypothetical protein